MEPFRGDVLKCPACRDVVLRPFSSRLICDRCSGFFLTQGEVRHAIEDLCGPAELVFFDGPPGTRVCPRCSGVLTTCRLRVEFLGVDVATKATLDRCPTDGVWFDTDELEDVLARTHKKLTQRPNR